MACLIAAQPASADEGRMRQWLSALQQAKADGTSEDEMTTGASCVEVAARLKKRGIVRQPGPHANPAFSLSYGTEATAQALDVYVPAQAMHPAPFPVIVMVHGGAWCVGDKAGGRVVVNKVARWLPKGFIVVSVNYRMIPDKADPAVQAQDVASAIAYVEKNANEWKGDADKIIVMGHSAGAHLVSLVSADTLGFGVKPWLGTISLDSAALDVPAKMKRNHSAYHDEAFGKNEDYWKAVSPQQHLSAGSLPWLGVCSKKRDDSCFAAHSFADAAGKAGVKASVIEQDMTHMEINNDLGLPSGYTDAVEAFMKGLDEEVKRRLE